MSRRVAGLRESFGSSNWFRFAFANSRSKGLVTPRRLLLASARNDVEALRQVGGALVVASTVAFAEIVLVREIPASGGRGVSRDTTDRVGLIDFRDRIRDVAQFPEHLVANRGQAGHHADDQQRRHEDELRRHNEAVLISPQLRQKFSHGSFPFRNLHC